MNEHDQKWCNENAPKMFAMMFPGLAVPKILVNDADVSGFAGFMTVAHGGYVVGIHPGMVMRGENYAVDVMMHELVHIALIERDGDGDAAHATTFIREANRIGAALGLRAVQPATDVARYWPQSVRPPGYHKGLPYDRFSDEEIARHDAWLKARGPA